jgi:rhamnosyltransferase subunit B
MWTRKLQYNIVGGFADKLFQGINDFRIKCNLEPVKQVGTHWANSPLMTVGLFPSWFCSPANDWDKFVSLADFPTYDDPEVPCKSDKIDTFIGKTRSLGKPIVFCPGSAVMNAPSFFKAAVEACVQLNKPGILVTNFEDQIPNDLPDNVIHVRYIPFSKILTQVETMVHHGGIGTMASCFSSATSQIIIPSAYDQFDNGQRVARLGVGQVLGKKQVSGSSLAAAIKKVYENDSFRQKCAQIQKNMSATGTGIKIVCDLVLSKA